MHNQCTWQEQVPPDERSGLQVIARQRGHLFEWVPVCLAIGIGAYFSIRFEPTAPQWIALACVILAGLVGARMAHENHRPLVMALVIVACGFSLAGARAHLVHEPVLSYRYYGPITGRIVSIDRSSSNAVRITLDRVQLHRIAPHKMPRFVRVSLHGEQGFATLAPGMVVATTGHLSPPNGPVEPGGYDFQRQAWFQRLGGVGYTRVPVLAMAAPNDHAPKLIIHRLRQRISEGVREVLPGRTGAFAAALTTGDRSAMTPEDTEALRGSNLSHLLAISGLHVGLLTGFVFVALRLVMALIPALVLVWPTRKLAAVGALAAGGFYLALSGGNVATVRAFVMVAVMFVAILLDKRALTLRAVAIAAIGLLVLTPEALMGPGFQMSFAATTALVAVFGNLRNFEMKAVPKWAAPVVGLVLSSAIAGFATAPVAAAHFNRIADYGLLANLLSVPLMGAVVMPAAVLAAVLWPVGLSWIGLKIMALPLAWILGVAERVAALPGAQSNVVSPPGVALPMIAMGALFIILWQARPAAKAIGLLPIVLGIVLWAGSTRPTILVSHTGGLVGVMTPEGRALNKPKGDGFSAQSWLENDGDRVTQATAAARSGFGGKKGQMYLNVGGVTIAHLSGRGAVDRFADNCSKFDVVILANKTSPVEATGCVKIDEPYLKQRGAVAITAGGGQVSITGAKDHSGARLWNDWATRKTWAR